MKTSLPIHSVLPLLPPSACSDSVCENLGQYVSDRPSGVVQRVRVRRRTIRIPDGRLTAAIRAYRQNADLA